MSDRFIDVDRYIDDLFAPENEALTAAVAASAAAGLPDIQVSAGQGKLVGVKGYDGVAVIRVR